MTTAQAGAVRQEPPAASVLETRLRVVADYAADARQRRAAASAATARAPSGQREPTSAFDRLGEAGDRGVGKKYRASVVLRNDGPRAIRAVTWSHPLDYARGRRPPDSMLFKVTRDIKPGETRTLSRDFISAGAVVLRTGGQAVVESIEYADGSVWRRR
ncbi:MAG TPA: hypothetical protein VF736_20420 [Pyrinomonadaceae bacterium]